MFGFGKKSGPTLGLDINSSTISIIQIEKIKSELRISKMQSMPTPPDIVREGLLADPEAVGAAVRELLDSMGIPNKKPVPLINVGIPGQAVVIRLMPVPTGMPADELSDVVQQEAINNLPFPLEEANIDYCQLPATERTDPDGVRRVDVLLAAIQRVVVDSYWRMAEAANVQLGRLDISSLAVIRSLACSGMLTDDGQMTMAVNIRHDATDITLIKKGMPLFSRSVLLGVETLGEAISRSIDAPMDEALSLLPRIQLGSVPTSDPRIGQAAQVARSVFGDLTAEVGRSLEFYMSQVGAVQVDQVILSGPGCIVPGLHEFVANRLNIETIIANPLEGYTYDRALIPDEQIPLHAMLLGLVADPAMTPVKSVQVNLNKQGRTAGSTESEGTDAAAGDDDGDDDEEEVDTPWFGPALAAGVGLLLIAGGGWGALAFHYNSEKDGEIAQVEQAIDTAKHQVDQLGKVQLELTGLREKKATLEKIVVHGQPRSVVLKLLKDTVPQGVQIISVDLNDNRIAMACDGIDFAKASHFAINLDGSNMVDDVSLSNIHRSKKYPTQVHFSINATIKPDASTVNPDDFKLAALTVGPAASAPDEQSQQQGQQPRQQQRPRMSVSKSGKPTIYYFYQASNPICKIFGPEYEQLKTKFASAAEFQTVDMDQPGSDQIAAKFKIPSAPDFAIADQTGAGQRIAAGKSPTEAITAALQNFGKVAGSNAVK